MNSRVRPLLAVLALLGAGSQASAIQEVTLGPRAPTFAAGPAASGPLGLGLASGAASFSGMTFANTPDVPAWAFSGGRTERIGSMLFNTTSGPSWTGADRFGFGPGRFGDLGFTTRNTTGVMATDKLMFYTSVGSTTFNTGSGVVPVAPGLQPFQPVGQRMDARAGFRMELAPGLTFGMEATVLVPPAR
jgi:hypothetical protein